MCALSGESAGSQSPIDNVIVCDIVSGLVQIVIEMMIHGISFSGGFSNYAQYMHTDQVPNLLPPLGKNSPSPKVFPPFRVQFMGGSGTATAMKAAQREKGSLRSSTRQASAAGARHPWVSPAGIPIFSHFEEKDTKMMNVSKIDSVKIANFPLGF